jgi:rRNA processing protein Krr1/Pno1
MEEVKIKDYTRHNRLQQVKSRVIGSEGRALKTLSSLSECFLKLSDNSVFIIGHTDDVKITRNAVISLIKGSKHSNVYASLEHKPNFDEDEELIEQELQKYKKSHFSHQKAL